MPPPTDDFDRVRDLLSLLAHETPPPGYFDTFSSKVIARIEGEMQRTEVGWWQQLIAALGVRPWAGAAAAGLGAVLLLTGLDRVSALQAPLAEGDLFLSGAPIAVQAAMLDWSAKPRSEEPVFLPTVPGNRMDPVWAEPRQLGTGGTSLVPAGAVLPASFTPAY